MSRAGVGTATDPVTYSVSDDRTIAGEHCDPEHDCITCGDVAVPLRVELIDADRRLALCEDQQGRRETVEIALVEPVAVGERLLVHAGTAIARAGGHTPRLPGREAEDVREVSS